MYSLSKLPRLTGSVLLGTVLAGGVFGYAVLGWVAVQKVIVQQNAQPHQERIEMAQGQAQETESGQRLGLRLEPEPEKAQEEQEPETTVTEPVAEITAAAAIAPLAAPEVKPESVQPVTPEREPAVQDLPLVAPDTETEPVVLASEPETTPVQEPEQEPPVQEAQPVSRGNRSHAEIAELALTLVGIPYVAGGSSRNGFDCSGFTKYVYAGSGIAIPRTSYDQFAGGTAVSRDDLELGDLLFFKTYDSGASHVGVYIGGGSFVHASNPRDLVKVTSLSDSYYASRYLGARRYE